MDGRGIPGLIAFVAAVSLLGCTGRGPTGAPPLERAALLPVQLMALPFMILRPFAPLIQAGMQAGIQMAPYALMFCNNETGPSEFMLAGVRRGGEGSTVPSLPVIETCLAEDGTVVKILAVDLNEIGGAEHVEKLLAAMEKNGMRCRWTVVDAADILSGDSSLNRLRNVLVENGVTLYTTGGLSAVVAARFGAAHAAPARSDSLSRSWSAAFGPMLSDGQGGRRQRDAPGNGLP
jgi:hypothetical protein